MLEALTGTITMYDNSIFTRLYSLTHTHVIWEPFLYTLQILVVSAFILSYIH